MSVVVVADPDTSHGSKDTKKTTETTGRTKLANTGRITDSQTRMDEDIWIENHPSLQDGARLQALGIKQIYKALIGRLSKKHNPMKLQEILNEAKDKEEENSGLRPTNERILKGFKQ